ncbi:hypothetical protein BDB01DRAFT_804629 [Pilobolus umbonatus]|nr:hypothetical protein BDB01DRAFT_804629 [Pilobolus umbonatus]
MNKPWFKHLKVLKEWQYLRIRLLSAEPIPAMTETAFRMSIQQALQEIYGHMGASCYINILDWNQYTQEGIVKIKQSELTTVWSALLNHLFSVSDIRCTFDIISSSAYLTSLATDNA